VRALLLPAAMLVGLAFPSSAQIGNCEPPSIDSVIGAMFENPPPATCDLNGDMTVNAADIVTALRFAAATATPSESASPTATRTPSPNVSPTTTTTPTPPTCPQRGADLTLEVINETGLAGVTVSLGGELLESACAPGAPATSYELTGQCAEDGAVACAQVGSLAPGVWRHSIVVSNPGLGQVQHQRSLLVVGAVPNRVTFTVFPAVLSVTTTSNSGTGSLRQALQLAPLELKPLLIQFDPLAFPPAVPTAITLSFALPTLATDDVTIDGIDSTGAVANRIIDAGGNPIGALSVTGARNRIVGMWLRNAGQNQRDVLSIAGPFARGNIVERTLVEGAASADGIGIDDRAGDGFGDDVNVIRDCEVRGASDKGIKVTLGAYARIERTWVHDNANGGIQATLGGHVEALHNVVERNRGGTAQNGLSANALDDESTADSGFSELRTRGNISRNNGANGISVRAFSVAEIRDDYLAGNGSSGLRVFNDIGPPASCLVEGTSAVCNQVDGAVIANASTADLGGGSLGSTGHNAFTQNNLPAGATNLRNSTGALVSALNNQWEHCGRETSCDDAQIAAFDLGDHGVNTLFSPAQAHRAQEPVLTTLLPSKGRSGELLRIFGTGFNVIDGHFAEDSCSDVAGRNRCVPLRGNCVRIDGLVAQVEAVTPTMLVVRGPLTCVQPVEVVVRVDHGATVATSNTLIGCTNEP
jgi:hypothetical protein